VISDLNRWPLLGVILIVFISRALVPGARPRLRLLPPIYYHILNIAALRSGMWYCRSVGSVGAVFTFFNARASSW
jgi:hypothetical protein